MKDIVCAVIPVMDLMIGQVVWAKGGNRDAYRPLSSRLTNESAPLTVARAIFGQTGCDWIYLADIDSFAGARPSWDVFERLNNAGFKLLVDANWLLEDRLDQAIDRWAGSKQIKLIISTETLHSIDQFDQFKRMIAAGLSPVFSLDMRGSAVIAQDPRIKKQTPLELVDRAWNSGVRQMIHLDLSTVGLGASDCQVASEGNPHDPRDARLSLINAIANQFPEMTLISGGGARNDRDCQQLLSAGCQHVLVASAIYDGKLTPDDIADLLPYASGSISPTND